LELTSATYKTYFRTICLNLYKNHCRKNKRLANVTPEELTLPGNAPTIERELNQAEFRRIIKRGLTALGDECRQLIRNQLIEKKPLNELAEKMGISHANARQKASRCRKKLRKSIAADPYYHEMIAK
jgi:RNA polymerase sigma factor (sigma-70 family)